MKSLYNDKFFIDGLHNASLRPLSRSIKIIFRTFNRILIMMSVDLEKYSGTKFSMFTTCNAKLSQRFANLTVILYSTTIIFFSSKIFVKHVDDSNASNMSTRLLILEMDLPFDANQRFVYESVIIIQFVNLLFCADANCLINALLINLVSFAGRKRYIIAVRRNQFLEILLTIQLMSIGIYSGSQKQCILFFD